MPCPTCKRELLPFVASGQAYDSLWWCPGCNRRFQNTNPNPLWKPPAPAPSDLAEASGKTLRQLRWWGRLELDGRVTLSVNGTGSVAEANDLSMALGHLRYMATQRLETLSGTNRWAFRRAPAIRLPPRRPGPRGRAPLAPLAETLVYFAAIHDSERLLKPWTCGGRQSEGPRARTETSPARRALEPQCCESCSKEIPKGTRGYRPDMDYRETGQGFIGAAWSEVRFCAGCVEKAAEVRSTATLRVIDGGKSCQSAGGAT